MSVETEITRIEGAVADSLAAVAEKGVTVPSTAKVEDLPGLIGEIEQGGGTPEPSRFYLNKCILTVDDGYQIVRIPIVAGDVIDLGNGSDVSASTNWGSYYHAKSHPAMTFQGWNSSIDIIDNQFVVPDDICTDYHVGAIYRTTDNLNYGIYYDNIEGYKKSSLLLFSWTYGFIADDGIEVGTHDPIRTWVAFWFGSDLTEINNGQFTSYTALTSINIPYSVTHIGDDAFRECFSLTSVNIPNSVTELSNYTFGNCYSLTSVNIPNSITGIWTSVFNGCGSLTSVDIPNGVTGVWTRSFNTCVSLTSVNIPNSVERIEGYAFYNCTSLTSVSIPNSVTYIGNDAFRDCSSLLTLILSPTTPPTLGAIAIPDTTIIFVPEGCLAAYQAATNWSAYADNMLENTAENRLKFGL